MSKWCDETIYIARYIGSGVFNTLIGFFIIISLMWTGVSPYISNITGYTFGLLLSFLFSKKFVFRSSGSVKKEFFRYLVSFFIAFCLNVSALYLLLNYLEISPIFAQVAAAGVYTFSMYILIRLYTFLPNSHNKHTQNSRADR